MGSIELTAESKWLIKFQGQVVPCLVNLDCPLAPGQECAGSNATSFPSTAIWAEQSMCVCHANMQGELCDEFTPMSWYMFASSIAASCLCLLLCLWGVWLVYRDVVRRKKKFGNALHTTLLAAILGCLGCGFGFGLLSQALFLDGLRRYENLYDVLYPMDAAGSSMGFMFSMIALLNISLLWIEVAERVKKGNSRSYGNINKYRIVLIVYCKCL
jgi:hypothetical protein